MSPKQDGLDRPGVRAGSELPNFTRDSPEFHGGSGDGVVIRDERFNLAIKLRRLAEIRENLFLF